MFTVNCPQPEMTLSSVCNQIRILHVFARMDRGGAEMRTLEIMRRVDGRRYRFEFCALSGLPGKLDPEIRTLGSEVHLLRRGRPGFGPRLRALLRKGAFQVVHCHLLNYSGVILRLAAQCGTPVRAVLFRSVHDGKRPGPIRAGYRRLMHRWIDRYATHILAVSQGAMEGAWRADWHGDPRCRVIYDGLDQTPFQSEPQTGAVRQEFGLPEDAAVLIHVGSMREAKNHLRLLSIFAEVQKRLPAARLLLVGRGGNRIERRVQRRAAELGLADHVIMAGERNDVARLLKAADAMVFPSLWEGLPGAVLEACAAGTPVVASDLPCVREIAARLPGVRCVSLGQDDAHWAGTVAEMAGRETTEPARHDAYRRFNASVFTLDHCIAEHCEIWKQAMQQAGDQAAASPGNPNSRRLPKPALTP